MPPSAAMASNAGVTVTALPFVSVGDVPLHRTASPATRPGPPSTGSRDLWPWLPPLAGRTLDRRRGERHADRSRDPHRGGPGRAQRAIGAQHAAVDLVCAWRRVGAVRRPGPPA